MTKAKVKVQEMLGTEGAGRVPMAWRRHCEGWKIPLEVRAGFRQSRGRDDT